nr:MAG TPA: hypothetical protein [Caudoviricetes sp.]
MGMQKLICMYWEKIVDCDSAFCPVMVESI